jgi:hypothetical protein
MMCVVGLFNDADSTSGYKCSVRMSSRYMTDEMEGSGRKSVQPASCLALDRSTSKLQGIRVNLMSSS